MKKNDSKYIIKKDGKYALTEEGKKVPKKCPKCGADMTLRIMGEPVYICKNDHYFGTMKFNLKESFDFNQIKDTRAKDISNIIDDIQHKQDFIDVPHISPQEKIKLKGFVLSFQKNNEDIHYSYYQDKDDENGRVLKIYTNNKLIHIFLKKFKSLEDYCKLNGYKLTVMFICDKLNVWYTGLTSKAIAPNEFPIDLETNCSILKNRKFDNLILDGFVVNAINKLNYSTVNGKVIETQVGKNAMDCCYQLCHNSNRLYLVYSEFSLYRMNPRYKKVFKNKLKFIKTSKIKEAVDDINNDKEVDTLNLNYYREVYEGFDFNTVKKEKTTITAALTIIDQALLMDYIGTNNKKIYNIIESLIKAIKRYDYNQNLRFYYNGEENILYINVMNFNIHEDDLQFNTSPVTKCIKKFFNLGLKPPYIKIQSKKDINPIINLHLSTGISMTDMSKKSNSLTYFIKEGLYILDISHLHINTLTLERFILSLDDIELLYNLDVKNFNTPMTRFTNVDNIDYSKFIHYPYISFINNQGKIPKGLHMEKIIL